LSVEFDFSPCRYSAVPTLHGVKLKLIIFLNHSYSKGVHTTQNVYAQHNVYLKRFVEIQRRVICDPMCYLWCG